MRIFKPNVILHIEDALEWRERFFNARLKDNEAIIRAYGSQLSYFEYWGSQEAAEIVRIEDMIGEGPGVVNVDTGSAARAYLETTLPGVIISDSGFPMNGERIVDWLISHGLKNYPLIGLSSRSASTLPEAIKKYFIECNGRYFEKASFEIKDLVSQIIFNRSFNILTYST